MSLKYLWKMSNSNLAFTPVLLPGKSQGLRSLVGCSPWDCEESETTELLHFHFPELEKEMATHSSVLAWRISGTGEAGGLPSMDLHRVGHYWRDLAAAARYFNVKNTLLKDYRMFSSWARKAEIKLCSTRTEEKWVIHVNKILWIKECHQNSRNFPFNQINFNNTIILSTGFSCM